MKSLLKMKRMEIVNKYFTNCSTSLPIMEMPIKAALRFSFMSVRKQTLVSIWEGDELIHCSTRSVNVGVEIINTDRHILRKH